MECIDCGSSSVSVNLTTNSKPQDTTWNIEETKSKQVVVSGGEYGQSFHTCEETTCLPEGRKHVFTIYYSNKFDKSHILTVGDKLVKNGGNFMFSETTNFVITGVTAPFPTGKPTTIPTKMQTTRPTLSPTQAMLIETSTSTPTNAMNCAIENEKSTGCGSKTGKAQCCTGLVCYIHQFWRCVKGKRQ